VIEGSGQMYNVFQTHGETYRVNDEHILTLQKGKDIFDISIKDYIKLDDSEKNQMTGIKGKVVKWNKQHISCDPYEFGYNLNTNYRIPIEYIVNDKNIRLELLAGIIDRYGNINEKYYHINISLMNEELINDIMKLVRTLGFMCNYSINISGENIWEIPIRLSPINNTLLK
jgi:hypothetical protein